MPPSDLAILFGAGPNTPYGTRIVRILSHPSHGNLAVTLLARRSEALDDVVSVVRKTNLNAVLEAFPTDNSKALLEKVFRDIKVHQSFRELKLQIVIYSIKHSSKKPFLKETYENIMDSLETFIGEAFTFAQESLKRFFADHRETPLAGGAPKKEWTFIFTGTLGALRCSAQFAAYGAGRAYVRQVAQTLAREMSEKGVPVVHTIANCGIVDVDGKDQKTGKKMSANAVGETYLWFHNQKPCLWTHELDKRPACEKF